MVRELVAWDIWRLWLVASRMVSKRDMRLLLISELDSRMETAFSYLFVYNLLCPLGNGGPVFLYLSGDIEPRSCITWTSLNVYPKWSTRPLELVHPVRMWIQRRWFLRLKEVYQTLIIYLRVNGTFCQPDQCSWTSFCKWTSIITRTGAGRCSGSIFPSFISL